VPWALDDVLIAEQLERLAGGESVVRPVYDYATHARAPRGLRVGPADAIVVEGLFALYWERVRRLFDLSAFLFADHKTCLARRIARDTRERGRTLEEVIRQYRRQVRPMYDRFVRPTRHRADVLLGGTGTVADLVARVMQHTRQRSRQSPRHRATT
jgi:uridine kinase